MKQVADAVALSRNAATRLCLEALGLLVRHLCPTDRRGIHTDVTGADRPPAVPMPRNPA